MSFIAFLLSPIIHVVFTGSVLWVAAKLTSIDLRFKEATIAVILSAIVSWIPLIGGLLSIIVEQSITHLPPAEPYQMQSDILR